MLMHQLLRSLLFVVLLAPLASQALTLGEARVNSFLNQPLDAEIDLIGLAPGQHEDLRLRIANERHFERLGIVYDHFLNTLQFDVVQSGGQWIVRARSTRPVTEPFIDFPLQMTWPGGQLIKQYTMLLDPQRRQQPARAARTSRSAAPPAPAPRQSSTPVAVDSYGPVQAGETLWPIAKKLKPAGITTRQMAMALLRANPEAFIDGNINLLRAGATLSIPPRAFVEELDAATAHARFTEETRPRRAPPVATSPRTLDTRAATTPSETKVTPPPAPVGEAEPVAESKANDAQLRIVTSKEKSAVEAGNEQDLQEQLLVTMEEIESNRITTGAIESRLERLEAELARMQQLVELKDAQIAALQSEVSTQTGGPEAAQTGDPAESQAAADTGATGAGPVTPVQLPAPAPVVKIETVAASAAAAPARPWHEEYLWLVWVLLGLLGLAAVLMIFRGPRATTQEAAMADLPPLDKTSAPAYPAPAGSTPDPKDIQQAEEDFRVLARETRVEHMDDSEVAEELPELEIAKHRPRQEATREGLTNSLLDEMLDDSKSLSAHPEPADKASEFSDDDIASWVAELGAEVDRADARSANDEQVSTDDDIPSILTELDDQLGSADEDRRSSPSAIDLEPVDDFNEDDTFSMSLDLARAYLEIGDQEGARDMLKQALSGARNPDHRRQIEELLQQID